MTGECSSNSPPRPKRNMPASAPGRSRDSAHQLLFQVTDYLPHMRSNFHAILHQAASMQDGSVIAAAKSFADRAQRTLSHLTGEEHGYLPGKSDILGTPLAGHVSQSNIKVFGDFLLNRFDADR